MHKAPVFTTRAKHAQSIDPLGLQSANMSLYRTLLPGINNVANSIRVYSALCWVLREARELARRDAKNPEEARELCTAALEKMDLLLVWCNREHRGGLPGTDRHWPKENELATLRLSEILSDEQRTRKKDGLQVNTARGAYLLTAPQYRPSLVNGLQFLQLDTKAIPGAFMLSEAGKDLADGFARHLAEMAATSDDIAAVQAQIDWLADARQVQILPANVSSFYPLLRLDSAHPAEQAAFLSQYLPSPGQFPIDKLWDMRHKGLTLALRALVAAEERFAAEDGFVPVDIVRHAMGSGFAPGGSQIDLTNLPDARGLWASLQVRQYIKLVLETLLRLTELQIHDLMTKQDPRRIGDVAALAANLGANEPGMTLTVGTWVDAWQTAQGDADTLYEAGMAGTGYASQVVPMKSLHVLFDELRKASKFKTFEKAKKAVLLVAVALTYCAAEAENWPEGGFYRRDDTRDRLSPAHLATLARRYADKPVTELVAMVIRDFVVNLHFSVVRERSEAEPGNLRDRYRIVPGDEGLERDLENETKLTEPPVLTDRLYCAMQLLAQAGLLDAHPKDPSFRITDAGRKRAAESLALWPTQQEARSSRTLAAAAQMVETT
ncbi:conserved hypothetical protein [Burkholderia sp. 8Y]|uniref:hypothetical protein n=1 Tax=Burkholderia sp. 8Y TaxID=2653133 RepID=UPI0012F2B9B7|nr:hypothetical protein [Burkholderia sp. 8Y]VXC51278.1 conserved hypothetical protein [Burkholderia sp. 8Y]